MATRKNSTPTKGRKPPTRASAMRKADTWFQRFIRTRDAQEYGGRAFRCISCGRVLPMEQCNAGHYVPRTRMATRYDEANVHAQCIRCNHWDEGARIGYRQGLIEKIGLQRVQLLEASGGRSHTLTATELEAIAAHYKKRTEAFRFQIK